MMLSLSEKIEFEFQCFYAEILSGSRDSIFTASSEIEYKRKIYQFLVLLKDKLTAEEQKKLLMVSNLLDSAYSFIKKDELMIVVWNKNLLGILLLWLDSVGVHKEYGLFDMFSIN